MTSVPLGPRLPAILQLLNWIYRPILFMEECVRRYGDGLESEDNRRSGCVLGSEGSEALRRQAREHCPVCRTVTRLTRRTRAADAPTGHRGVQ